MNNIFDKNSINPFNDPEFRKEFLKDKGLLKEDKEDKVDEGYEILPPEDEPGKMISPVDIIKSQSKIPSSVGTIIHDVSSMRKPDKVQRTKEIKSALNKVFTDYNKMYGLNVHLNLDNTASMLAELSDPQTSRTFQLYVSQMFGSFKSILYMRIMQAALLLVDELLSPKNLLGDELAISDKWILIDKIADLFMKFEEFKDSIEIKGAGEELKQISENQLDKKDAGDVRDSKMVQEFMKAMLDGIKSNDNENKEE